MATPELKDAATTPSDEDVQAFCDLLDQMRVSMSAARDIVKSLREKQNATSELDTREGISLLSLKHHLMLSYLQSLTLLTARRAIGDSLADRATPQAPFSAKDRAARGDGAGDRVDATIEARVVLEKVKVLEGRMKYQIDKLVRVADEGASADNDIANDPLAFRPNPQALMDAGSGSDGEGSDDDAPADARDGIYRPPKLAPMPYTESSTKSKDKSARRAPVPSALAHLAHLDPSKPYTESTSGLGGGATSAHGSARARELQRMTAFEEENFTRLVMKKRDAKRRTLDEADIALGGTGMASGSRRRVPGVGLEDEFGDIIRSVGRSRQGVVGDGYEELRQRGKKESVLARSRARSRDDSFDDLGGDGPRQRKRTRFDKEVKAAKKRTSSKSSRK
ncbi:hypothetical protein GSI_07253 [Ganoderma sinense ZZ0214-1]|uniref:Neuroguidin n=1 Tax=Ganoderma sinense ZZ0214-1 TaxID=1077348 RepID=A0A2G8S9W1_9APHY|nr:hypothetical protein GSI_07253 [Ganoderma sinense ZZ0214-1]